MAPARPDGREPGQMRPVSIQTGVNPYAEGSALCSFGRTQVLCTATLEAEVPAFLAGSGQGWVTAEYAMLPRATHTRSDRQASRGGRAKEISRLIGRSLRACCDLKALEDHTVRLDCDVLVADGGTRTAAISGAYVALALALRHLGMEPIMPLAAVSVGKYQDQIIVDLCYQEDSQAQVDLNLVLAPGPRLIEVQATAERGTFTPQELDAMLKAGDRAAQEIFAAQRRALEGRA